MIMFLLCCTADSAPVVPLDYTMIALETSKPPDAVRNCLNETVMYLSRCIASELNIDFVFRDMGILSVKHMEVQMRFYEKFLLSLNTTGNIKEVLGNVSLTVLAALHVGFQAEIQGPVELMSPGVP